LKNPRKKNMEEIHTKVTTINNRYHCRILRTKDDKVLSEMACAEKQDVGFCIRYMLRMYDKCGGTSLMADASRHRGKNQTSKGKIWYPSQIPVNEVT
jgi:hypothetical protein